MKSSKPKSLNLVEPAYIALDGKGGGEIVFGALRATLECGCQLLRRPHEMPSGSEPPRRTGPSPRSFAADA